MSFHGHPDDGFRPRGFDAQLYSRLQRISLAHLSTAFAAVLGKADDWLFDQSQVQGAASGVNALDAMRMLRAARKPLEESFAGHFASSFEALKRRFANGGETAQDLGLLEEDELEVQLASEVVMDSIARAHGPALDALEKRFAAVLGVHSLEFLASPLAVVSIANAIHSPLKAVQLPSSVRVVLFKFYEREIITALGPMLAELNEQMLRAGVMPELGNPGGDQHRAAFVEPVAPAPAARTAPAAQGDEEFAAICDLLHAWRPAFGEAPAEPVSAPPQPNQGQRAFAPAELVSVLTQMQNQVPESVVEALSRRDVALSTLLKRDLFRGAGKLGLPAEQYRMSRDDEDAVDLVGMLFDVLLDERDFEERARHMVSRMVVPYVKAAVLDRKMFQLRSHPARRLLNSVSEAVEGNHGEGQQERELLVKAESVVDRLVAEFNEDMAIFETLEQELRAFLEQHRRRIELTERRATEAQRGQERLEQSRQLAMAELEARTAGRALPEALGDFFGRNWTHHLSMIALREGTGSPAWNAALGVADSLLALLPAPGKPARPVGSTLQSLREPIAQVLASSGITGDAAQETIRQIGHGLESESPGRGAGPSVPKAVPASNVAAPAAGPGLRLVSDKDRLDVNAEDLALFRDMAVGTWIQIAEDDGRQVPAKMSWVSPISSRLMFVNRRGVRVLVGSVEELAAMKKAGKLVVHAQESTFDQALHSVIGRLKNDAG